MKYARLFSDDAGESHFEDAEVEFTGANYVHLAPPLDLSVTSSAEHFGFMRAPPGWSSDFHVTAERNMFFVLTGEWEVTASDGESRRFAAGRALLVEDTTGKGHASRVVSETESIAAMIQLPRQS